MSEPSDKTPHGRADLLADLQAGDTRCTARSKRTGQRCKLPSMLGGNVCRAHGGAAPQTKAKAQRRLQQAADALVQRLLQFALDGKVDDPTALRAIRDALDRAGLKTSVEVDVTVKPPFESILEAIEGGSRSAYRASVGRPDSDQHPPALADHPRALDPDTVLDAEIVDDTATSPHRNQQSYGQPMTLDDDDWQPGDDTAPGSYDAGEPYNPFGPTGPPDSGLMPFDHAVIAAGDERRRIGAQRQADYLARREQRALPPGRSS